MNVEIRLKNKKKIVTATLIAIILVFITFRVIYANVICYIHFQAEEKMTKISEILVEQIDGDDHERFIKDSNTKSTAGEEISGLLLGIKEKFPEIIDIYIMAQTGEPNVWEIALTTNTNIRKNSHFMGGRQNLTIPRMCLGTIEDEVLVHREKNNFVSIYKPIHNSKGEQAAILGIDVGESEAIEQAEKLLNKAWGFLAVVMLALGFICLVSIDEILKSVKLLVKQSKEIRQGKKLYFEEGINRELGPLIRELNKTLQRNQHREERLRRFIKKIIEEKENIFGIYKDVIGAVTQNKILLLSRKEFIKRMSDDFPIYSTKLTRVQDITKCRKEIDDVLIEKNLPWWSGKNRTSILLCLSEAITNAVKHAGSGEVLLSIKNGKLTIYVLDCGKGIDLKKLPYTIFIKGFSTEQTSLGAGFLLMEKYMDKIILSTSERGTFLALQKQMSEEGQVQQVRKGDIYIRGNGFNGEGGVYYKG